MVVWIRTFSSFNGVVGTCRNWEIGSECIRGGCITVDYFSSSDLKPILHSKRANLYYLEHCRVLQKDGRIVYLTDQQQNRLYFNIPVANTTVLLLGTGTSITQAAVRMLAQAGVVIGFGGGGGTPLFAAAEIEWINPQSEYRPTEYLQSWVALWLDPDRRLSAAKAFLRARGAFLQSVWSRDRDLMGAGISADDGLQHGAASLPLSQVERARSTSDLLSWEAQLTKRLYRYVATAVGIADFARDRTGSDLANLLLNHGNYLAYGLAACALWVLGIPHGFAVLHGKTRRGALVFDVADLVKDAIVLPFAFVSAALGERDQAFRDRCLQAFVRHKALDFMFNTVKNIAMGEGGGAIVDLKEPAS